MMIAAVCNNKKKRKKNHEKYSSWSESDYTSWRWANKSETFYLCFASSKDESFTLPYKKLNNYFNFYLGFPSRSCSRSISFCVLWNERIIWGGKRFPPTSSLWTQKKRKTRKLENLRLLHLSLYYEFKMFVSAWLMIILWIFSCKHWAHIAWN